MKRLILFAAWIAGCSPSSPADMGSDMGSCNVVCNTAPASTCLGSTTLRRYDATGTCANNSCTYPFTNVVCASGCAASACTGGDPCDGISCVMPPADTCVDANTLRSYLSSGTCSAGSCSYDANDVTCPGGCQAGVCTGDPCAGVTCDQPPVPSCTDDSTLQSFASPGTCSNGLCTYAPSNTTCTNGCLLGACKGDPCAGVACDQAPASFCDGDTLRSYSSSGTCSTLFGAANCTYVLNPDVTCATHCSSGECVAECTPACNNAICGSDGCGGSCGTCAASQSCISSSSSTYCDCDTGQPTYTFDGSGIDWSMMDKIAINFQQYRGDGVPTGTYGAMLTTGAQTAMLKVFEGCGPDIEATIDYAYQDGTFCEFSGRVTGETTLTLAMPTKSGNTCVAPMP